jgi:16S rRNA (guanine(966)-N(2))-methyltransferase RsmD
MRIIGGQARGRRLKAPKGQSLRPTAARVKEALFDILPRDLSGVKLLDLYAGTGSVTIEALSRGAAEAMAIDSSSESGKIIRENLRRARFVDRAKVWIIPVARALRLLARRGESFDMIFLDPPYEQRLVETTLKIVAKGGLLRPAGVLIAEHSIREELAQRYDSLLLDDQRRYGSTLLTFFRSASIPKSIERGPANHGTKQHRDLSRLL